MYTTYLGLIEHPRDVTGCAALSLESSRSIRKEHAFLIRVKEKDPLGQLKGMHHLFNAETDRTNLTKRCRRLYDIKLPQLNPNLGDRVIVYWEEVGRIRDYIRANWLLGEASRISRFNCFPLLGCLLATTWTLRSLLG